ncbi:MAG TPA: zf-HC2 domain-containing protein [Acidobacteriota bacterium]|nr:zf-HC2 domain-containing protein [Acidobacteriota bacterium]
MKTDCHVYQEMIPRALLGDLEAGRVAELEQHLAACPGCRAEQTQYRETLEHLAAVKDVPVPRHFLVPADTRTSSLGELFQALARSWRLAGALVAFALCVSATMLALSNFQFRAQNGVYAFSFGRPLSDLDASRKTEAAINALRDEMQAFVEQAIQAERQHYVALLRAELEKSSRSLSTDQRRFLELALSDVETRINQRIVTTGASLENRTARSLDALYAALQDQRARDLAFLRQSIAQTARRSEANDRQTQEVLSALLEVADLQIQGIMQ